jgi:hypothetical protein
MYFTCGRQLITVFLFLISCKILVAFVIGNLHTILLYNSDFRENQCRECLTLLPELQN